MLVRDKILRLKGRGLTSREIAARVGSSADYVARVLAGRNETKTERIRKLSRLSTDEIAAATGASPDLIRRVLNRDGRGNYAKAVLAAASPSKTLAQIAREVGCSLMTVKRVKLLHDVPHAKKRVAKKSVAKKAKKVKRVKTKRAVEIDDSKWDAEYRAAMKAKKLPGVTLKGDAWERYRKIWQARQDDPSESARARCKRLFGKDEEC